MSLRRLSSPAGATAAPAATAPAAAPAAAAPKGWGGVAQANPQKAEINEKLTATPAPATAPVAPKGWGATALAPQPAPAAAAPEAEQMQIQTNPENRVEPEGQHSNFSPEVQQQLQPAPTVWNAPGAAAVASDPASTAAPKRTRRSAAQIAADKAAEALAPAEAAYVAEATKAGFKTEDRAPWEDGAVKGADTFKPRFDNTVFHVDVAAVLGVLLSNGNSLDQSMETLADIIDELRGSAS